MNTHNLKVCTWNVCLGAKYKKHHIAGLLGEHNIDVLCIQEAEIKPNDEWIEANLVGSSKTGNAQVDKDGNALGNVVPSKVGEKFFNQMGYKTHISPYKWEGEADIKYLYGNKYIGGYGIRSNIKAYEWMEENFNMDIIKVAMVDEYLYHLDCSIFALNQDQTLVCTELYDEEEIKEIERHTEIIDIHVDDALGGLTNSVKYGNMILCASNISEMKKSHEYYEGEKHKIETLEKICSNAGMEPVIFNLSEYMKSGAMLSCMVMHLNRVDHLKTLL
jgi:hypothetical protein